MKGKIIGSKLKTNAKESKIEKKWNYANLTCLKRYSWSKNANRESFLEVWTLRGRVIMMEERI